MGHRSLPRLNIILEGNSLNEALVQTLVFVRVKQKLSRPSQCVMTFSRSLNQDYSYNFKAGMSLQIALAEFEDELFVGEITGLEFVYGVENEQFLHVKAYDALHKLRKSQQMQVFKQKTVTAIATILCEPHQISIESSDAGPMSEHIIYHHRNDLDFLQNLTWQHGFFFNLRKQALNIRQGTEGEGTAIQLIYGSGLREFKVEENNDSAITTLTVQSWSPDTLEDTSSTSSTSTKTDLAYQQTLLNFILPSAQSQPYIEAMHHYYQQRSYHFSGIADGNPALRPGTPVAIDAKDFTDSFTLTEVTHSIDAKEGFRSEINSYPPQPPENDHASQITLAYVLDNNDPENKGRIQVRFPYFANQDSAWLPVSQVASSSNRGFFALPQKDDTVLVLLLHNNPAYALILSNLYLGEAPEKVKRNANDAGFIFNGAYIHFGEREMEIVAAGKTLTIKADKIKFIKG